MKNTAFKKPQILVLSSTFPRWANDKEPAFVFELCRRLSPSFNITVLSPRTPGSLIEENMDGLRVIRYPYFFRVWENLATHGGGILNRLRSNPFNYLLVPFFLYGQLRALMRLINREHYDLIHAHWLIPQGLIAVIALALSRKKAPLLCTSHGGDLFALRGAMFQWLKRWIIKRSQALTVVSNAMKKMVVDMGIASEKVNVIPMGVDLQNTFFPDADVKRSVAEILFVGRLVEKKGVQYLLRAMPEVLKKRPDVLLTIAGAGPLEPALRQLAEELLISKKINFQGMMTQNRLPALYRRAALAVFPFVVAKSGDQEGFGLVQVEAIGCECPVIAGDLPAIHDIINHGKNGLLVPPENVQRLADEIVKALNDSELRLRLTAQARRQVMDKFDWEVIARKYSELYETLLNRRQ